MWELVTAAERAVLATATPLKRLRRPDVVFGPVGFCQASSRVLGASRWVFRPPVDWPVDRWWHPTEAEGFKMTFREAIESKLITNYRLWLPRSTSLQAQRECIGSGGSVGSVGSVGGNPHLLGWATAGHALGVSRVQRVGGDHGQGTAVGCSQAWKFPENSQPGG